MVWKDVTAFDEPQSERTHAPGGEFKATDLLFPNSVRPGLERFSLNAGQMIYLGSMTSAEPTKAEKALKRVLRISRLNGWSVIIIAALGALITLAMGDVSGMAVGVLIAVAGWMEVRGHKLLKKRNPDGMKALVRSQMFLLAIILVYCASRLGSFDDGAVLGNVTPDMESLLKEAGISKADIVPMVRTAFFAGYGTFALVTLFYQGGMALYYRAKTPLVMEALQTLPRPRVSVLPPSV